MTLGGWFSCCSHEHILGMGHGDDKHVPVLHTQGLSAADQLLLTELLPTQSPWKNDVT